MTTPEPRLKGSIIVPHEDAAAAVAEIEKRVRNAGGEVVALLKTGSAYFSPASAAVRTPSPFWSR